MKVNIPKLLTTKEDDYLFNLLNIDNFNKNTSHLRYFYKHLVKYEKKLPGNIFEFGCYKGRTLLAIALLLKKLNSKKIVYAFDSFKGFPSYSEYESFNLLKYRKDVFFKHNVAKKIRKFNLGLEINKKNISSSYDFSLNTKKNLLKKIKFLNLKNIIIVEGNFENTIPKFIKNYNKDIFSVKLDSDLYHSYNIVLTNIYPKLVSKGYIHLDEYYSIKFPGCKISVDKFCKNKKIKIKKNKNYKWEFERYYIQKK